MDVLWSSSPYINRFLRADTIAPGYANPQNLNRYDNPYKKTHPFLKLEGVSCFPQTDTSYLTFTQAFSCALRAMASHNCIS